MIPTRSRDLPHFTTALADRIITMAYTDGGLTRVYGFDPGGGWTLLKDDLGFVQEAVPVDGGVAVATGDSSGVSPDDDPLLEGWPDLERRRHHRPRGRPEPALSAVSLSDAGDGGIRAHWFCRHAQAETARSAVWVFSRAPLPSPTP